jgi:hypothetical protein
LAIKSWSKNQDHRCFIRQCRGSKEEINDCHDRERNRRRGRLMKGHTTRYREITQKVVMRKRQEKYRKGKRIDSVEGKRIAFLLLIICFSPSLIPYINF